MLSYRGRHQTGLAAATARVLTLAPDGGVVEYGSGVFVAPGLLATCAHVVAPGPGGTQRRYQVHSGGRRCLATVLVRDPEDAQAQVYSYPDVALLQVPFTDHPVVRVGCGDPQPPGPLYGYGCILSPDSRPMWDPMLLTLEGARLAADGGPAGSGGDGAATFLKTAGSQVRAGASGGGVIDLRTGALVGLLKLSRNENLDLGAVLVPAPVMMASFAVAGHDVAEVNRRATLDGPTVAARRERLGRAWQWLLAALAGLRLAPAQVDVVLTELARQDAVPAAELPAAEDLAAEDLAELLLHRELSHLGQALQTLARLSRDPAATTAVLDRALPFCLFGTRAWVDEDGAGALAAERAHPSPRVVHLSAGSATTAALYASRAAGPQDWRLVEPSVPDATVDPGSRLPAQLVQAVRVEILTAYGEEEVDAADPRSVAELWAEWGADACVEAADSLLFLLPAGMLDRDALHQLRQEFPHCVFAVVTAALPAALVGDDDVVLSLPGSLEARDETRATRRSEQIRTQIRRAATG